MPVRTLVFAAPLLTGTLLLSGCGSRTATQRFTPLAPEPGMQAQVAPAAQPQRAPYACPYKWLTYVHHKRLKRSDPRERTLAALALGTLYDPESIGPLAEALRDKDANVREAAHLSLQNLTGQRLPAADYAAWRAWWKAARPHYPDTAFVERAEAQRKALEAEALKLDNHPEPEPFAQGAAP